MQIWRDLDKVALMAAVFGACFSMLARVIGIRSPWLVLLLMFDFMALGEATEPPIALRMPWAVRATKRLRLE